MLCFGGKTCVGGCYMRACIHDQFSALQRWRSNEFANNFRYFLKPDTSWKKTLNVWSVLKWLVLAFNKDIEQQSAGSLPKKGPYGCPINCLRKNNSSFTLFSSFVIRSTATHAIQITDSYRDTKFTLHEVYPPKKTIWRTNWTILCIILEIF
jgi:hypothetical protein